MKQVWFGSGCTLAIVTLASALQAQSVELTSPPARGNLFHGTTALTRDGRWVVFAGRYTSSGPGINSLYGIASDGSSEPFLLYDHGDIPGVAREFDPGTVNFVHLTPNSRWAVFTVDERGSIYSARLPVDGKVRPVPRLPDPFERLAQADTSRDFQLTPDSSRAVFFGYDGLYSVPVDGDGASVELVSEDEGARVLAFAITADSRRVVYTLADEGSSIARRLFSVPIDGREVPTRLSPRPTRSYAGTPPTGTPGSAPASAAVTDFELSPDGTLAWFLLEEALFTHLYVVATDGSGPAQRLASGDVRAPAFAPDARRVVYRWTPASGGPTALIVHALDGSGPLSLVEPADAIERFSVLASTTRASTSTLCPFAQSPSTQSPSPRPPLPCSSMTSVSGSAASPASRSTRADARRSSPPAVAISTSTSSTASRSTSRGPRAS
jgi:hypothetical protein